MLKVQRHLAELEDAVCYTCGQALHEDKKAEIAERKQKELEDAQSYLDEISDKLQGIFYDLQEIGDTHGRHYIL